MKKIFVLTAMILSCLAVSAQKDVTTFLGIPIDGLKSEMRHKIISKGFTPQKYPDGQEYFEGEFNGTDVRLSIVTNNNKVYRIMLCDAYPQNEAHIKIRFNRLVNQFENNNRYLTLNSYTIPDEEDISFEMLVHKKTYDAVFYQKTNTELIDTVEIVNQLEQEIQNKFTKEEIENPTEEIQQEINAIKFKFAFDLMFKKVVWFRIFEEYGKYFITMYYDNEYNKANGEDL